MINLQYKIFTSEIDIIEWDWNKFKPHLFTNNGYCQLLMFCCHCLPCVSPFHKNLRSQIFLPSPYLPEYVHIFWLCSLSPHCRGLLRDSKIIADLLLKLYLSPHCIAQGATKTFLNVWVWAGLGLYAEEGGERSPNNIMAPRAGKVVILNWFIIMSKSRLLWFNEERQFCNYSGAAGT